MGSSPSLRLQRSAPTVGRIRVDTTNRSMALSSLGTRPDRLRRGRRGRPPRDALQLPREAMHHLAAHTVGRNGRVRFVLRLRPAFEQDTVSRNPCGVARCQQPKLILAISASVGTCRPSICSVSALGATELPNAGQHALECPRMSTGRCTRFVVHPLLLRDQPYASKRSRKSAATWSHHADAMPGVERCRRSTDEYRARHKLL